MLVEKALLCTGEVLQLLWHNKLAIIGTVAAYLLAKQTHQYYTSPLRKQGIPGPFLAKFTNYYRAYYTIVTRSWHRELLALHRVYGPVVWIAPDEVSCSDPYLRNAIYGFANDKKDETFFRKAPSYETGSINEDFSFVFEREPEKARLGKKYMSHFYSEAGLMKLEGNFDQAINEFVQGIEKHIVEPKKVCNFTSWMEYYSWDVATQITSNLSSGFCLAGKDLFNTVFGFRVIIQTVGALMPLPHALLVTTRWIRRMLFVYFLDQLYYTGMGIGEKKWKVPLEERIDEVRSEAPNHFMARFHDAQSHMREHFPLGSIVQGATIQFFNLMAGAIGVVPYVSVAAIYNLLTHPESLARVRSELAALDGDLSFDAFIHRDGSNKIPYLEAVVNESVRVFPSVSFSLSRASPPVGCQLHQFFIPPGYVVGMSGWSVNNDTGYFGPDAAEFKPERWFGDHPTEMLDGAPRSMKNYIEAGWLSFGAGGRVCIGRHLAVFMMIKIIAKIVMAYDLELVRAPEEYYTLFVELNNMQVKVKHREVIKA